MFFGIMANASRLLYERIMASLPGWMLLFAGAAMVAMVTLVPAWIDCRKLDWQLQVVQAQSGQLLKQQVAYEQFLTAMREHDPVVIERMAYYHLRLKPVGTSMLDDLMLASATGANGRPGHKVWHTLPTIEDLLSQPILQPSHACPPGVIPDSRLVRIATGQQRHLLLGLGVLCLFFGVLPPSQTTMTALAAGAATQARPEETPIADEPNEDWQSEAGNESAAELSDEFAAAAAVAERGTARLQVAATPGPTAEVAVAEPDGESDIAAAVTDDEVDTDHADTDAEAYVIAEGEDEDLIVAEIESHDEFDATSEPADAEALAAFMAEDDSIDSESEEEMVVAVVEEESPRRGDAEDDADRDRPPAV